MITGKSFIGSKLSALGDTTFKTFDPVRNEENEWTFYEANDQEIDEAVSLAWSAFNKYRSKSDKERASFLRKIAEKLQNCVDELLTVYCKESGLSKERAIVEKNRTVLQLELYAEMLEIGEWRTVRFERADPNRLPIPKPDLRKTMIPIGPIAVFGSSNFPFAYSTAGGDTASALAAGNPVVVKSHPMHAGTGELVSLLIIEAAKETDMPEGVFSNLNSKDASVGIKLVQHSLIKAVGFTGSIRGGRALFDLAAKREEPIPVFAEMGSINPVIISEGALAKKKEYWAEEYANSITVGTGQFCTNPGLILGIKSKSLVEFANLLAEGISKKESSCMLHPTIKAAYSKLKQEALAQDGVKQLGNKLSVPGQNFADQSIVMVDGEKFLQNRKLHREVFGPFSMVVTCKDKVELMQIIASLEGQLTGSLIMESEDIEAYKPIVEELKMRVGRLIFNGVPTGVEVCPAMHHGGPYPATTDGRFTAVGYDAIYRWVRWITYQNFPITLLPEELK